MLALAVVARLRIDAFRVFVTVVQIRIQALVLHLNIIKSRSFGTS